MAILIVAAFPSRLSRYKGSIHQRIALDPPKETIRCSAGGLAGLRSRHDGAGAAGLIRGCLQFLRTEAVHAADFTMREDGVVRLNPETREEGGPNSLSALRSISRRRIGSA